MSTYTAICPECEREFTAYDAAPRLRCSVACDVASVAVSVPRATLEQVREALRRHEQCRCAEPSAIALLDEVLPH